MKSKDGVKGYIQLWSMLVRMMNRMTYILALMMLCICF